MHPAPSRCITCSGHSRPVVDIRFRLTPNDSLHLLISSCHDKTSQLRFRSDGAWIGSFEGHNGAVWSSALDTNAARAATGSADFTAKLFDATTGALLTTFEHDHVVKAVDFSFDDRMLLTAGMFKRAQVFDLGTEQKVFEVKHEGSVPKARFVGENVFATGSADGMIRMFDVRQNGAMLGGEVRLFDRPAKKGVTDMEYLAKLDVLVASSGRTITLYDVKAGKKLWSYDVNFDVDAASISPDGKRIVAGGSDLWLHVFDVQALQDATTSNGIISSSSFETSVHKGHSGPIFCARWDVNGESFASGSEDGTIKIWIL